MTVHNYLPDQYRATATPAINHNYLPQQFADYREILDKIAALVERGDYTLGESVDEFERRISALIGARHTVGLGSGTDAIFLSLKALGVGPGDEVITPRSASTRPSAPSSPPARGRYSPTSTRV